MHKGSRIYVAGHRGLAGSAIVRALQCLGYHNLHLRTRAELDLLDQRAVFQFFESERPEFVFMAAAKVGGILANSSYPADFLQDNLTIQLNVTSAAVHCGVEKFVFLGSSCIYPRLAPQPIPESALLTGPLEPTNEWYAVAKIAGIKLIQAYRKQHGFKGISLMPTNLFGPGDNFDLASSHVLPALLRKFHEAKVNSQPEVLVWGTGKALREFLHVDDFADAAIHLMLHYDSDEIINVGTGQDLTIAELAKLMGQVVGYEGSISFDASRPDGTPRKLLDVSRLHSTGWRASISLEEGLCSTYDWYLASSAIRTSSKDLINAAGAVQSSASQ